MHQQWEDKIAFYVAGTLPPAEAAALEQHLQSCVACRRSLAEWQAVAGLVDGLAQDWARSAPPLSPATRAKVAARMNTPANGRDPARTLVARRYRHPPDRGGRYTLPLTLAAALAVLIFAGLLIALANRGDSDEQPGSAAELPPSPAATLGAMVSTPTLLPPPDGEGPLAQQLPGPTSTQWDLGILSPPAPTESPVPPPVSQTPPGAGTPIRPSPTSAEIAALSAEICSVQAVTGAPVNLYRWPGTSYAVIGILSPGETRQVIVQSGDSWYQVLQPGGGLGGWVRGGEVALQGACTDLWTPTPTLASPVPTGDCLGAPSAAVPTITLRAGPGSQFSIVTTLGQAAEVTARSDNGWWQIVYGPVGFGAAGWADPVEVTLYGFCDDLPVVPARDPTTASPIPPIEPSPTVCAVGGYFFTSSIATGCPVAAPSETWAAYQPFESGHMLWREDGDLFFVHFADGTTRTYTSADVEALPDNPVTEAPPADRYRPESGFGRIWGNDATLRDRLGWALAPEAGYTATAQPGSGAPGGYAVYITLPDGRVVGTGPDRWRIVN